MTNMWVIAIILANTLIPALAVFLLLRGRSTLAPDQCAGIALGFAPVLSCAATFAAPAVGWTPASRIAWGISALVLAAAIALGRRTLEFLRHPVTRLWGLGLCFWLAQELMVSCHGRALYVWDWEHHFHVAQTVSGLLMRNEWPLAPGRTPLLGVWAAPALNAVAATGRSYWVFQVTTVFAHAATIPIVYLVGARIGGAPRGGYLAAALALLCAGLTHNALYTWPKVLAAQLAVLSLYLYAVSVQPDRSRTGRIVGGVAAGLALAAGYQAHQSTIMYAAAFFVFAAARSVRTGRYPWAMLCCFTLLMALWTGGMLHKFTFAQLREASPYSGPGEQGLAKRWSLLTGHGKELLWPGRVADPIRREGGSAYLHRLPSDLDAQEWALRGTTDYWLPTFPVVGTLALLVAVTWHGRRGAAQRARIGFAWNSADSVAFASLVAGALVAISFLEPPGVGPVQAAMTPLLIFTLAVSGPLTDLMWKPIAAVLWIISLAQYIVFRGAFLALNVWPGGATEANLLVKRNAGILYAVDRSPLVRPLALFACATGAVCLLWFFLTIPRRGARPEAASDAAGPL